MTPDPLATSTIHRGSRQTDIRGTLALVVGSVLVLMGAGLLLAVGWTVLRIITEPTSVALLGLFLDSTPSAQGALSGHIAGTEFAIAIDEPLRTLLYLIVGLWVLGAVASILKVVTLTGKDLLMAARRPPSS
jgi:hypothetical protein